MNKDALVRKIKEKAKLDEKNRRDRRFRETMGFLVAKGFLKANYDLTLMPNKRLQIEDAVWAGKNVEPRILEVLPAAVLRLEKHFNLDPDKHKDLVRVIDQLRRREREGDAFCGMPYEKIKVWAEFPLRDKRVKSVTEKKVVKTFRLDPTAFERLKDKALKAGCSQTEIIEKLILAI